MSTDRDRTFIRLRSRVIGILTAAALAAGALTVAVGTPASAATCYGSAKSYKSSLYDNGWFWYGSVYPTTTPNCYDINVKPTNGRIQVRTCFLPTKGNAYCNGWRTIENNTWGTAATDVLDGTKFYLNFSGPSAGLVAY
ncbi:hypothetical protein [Streptomyces thermoalcalitolerans]|uniref:hypothetical protein n=1 Tax=Streptomyces thermoalcalitolerans TaxID=65605 RepID=UPI0031D023DB